MFHGLNLKSVITNHAISINLEIKVLGGQEIIRVTHLLFANDVFVSCNEKNSADNWHNSYPYFTNPLAFKRVGE